MEEKSVLVKFISIKMGKYHKAFRPHMFCSVVTKPETAEDWNGGRLAFVIMEKTGGAQAPYFYGMRMWPN